MKKNLTHLLNLRKVTFLSMFLLALFTFSIQAQIKATLLSESFDGSSIPAGWSTAGLGTSNWSISNTSNAGGDANEVKLYWSPQFNGISRFVTPALDLTGVDNVVFNFKHALDNYSGSHTLGIATSTDGINWNSGWTQQYGSNGTWEVQQLISTADFGSSSVKFCIYYSGNAYNINNWYFDDIVIFTQEQINAEISNILVDEFCLLGNIPISVKISNKGIETITSLTINYQINNLSTISETFSVNLNSLSNTTLEFSELLELIPGDYVLKVWISELNGNAFDGTEVEKNISVAIGTVQRNVMIEHFTSSTCGPCVATNNAMKALTNNANNIGKYCYVKYQMNWPGNGDPYYTAEGGVRRDYYGVNAVPHVVTEGGKHIGTLTQTLLDQYYNTISFIDIAGSFDVDGSVINVKVDIFPNISVTGLKLFVIVSEKETTGNVGTNGETSFNHVMMKMLPNAQGTTIDLTSGELQSFEFSQDMSSTHVEEMSDLEVAIFIQHPSQATIFNSRFANEYELHPNPIQNLQISKFSSDLNITWEAPVVNMLTPSGYKIVINGQIIEENYQSLAYTLSNAINDHYSVQITANYDEMTSVAVAKYFNSSISCNSVSNLTGVQDGHNAVLTWDAVDNAIGYIIKRNDVEIATLGTETTYTDENLEEGIYLYDVITKCSNNLESDPATVEVNMDFTSISEQNSQVTIFPNPAKDIVKISGENIEYIKIYNILGSVVKNISINDNNATISINDLQQGIYIFETKVNGEIQREKVVIQR